MLERNLDRDREEVDHVAPVSGGFSLSLSPASSRLLGISTYEAYYIKDPI